MKIFEYIKSISHWLWFSFGLSLLPLLFKMWKLYTINNEIRIKECIQMTISNGELFLICIPILGVAISEVLKSERQKITIEIIKIWIVGSAVCISVFSALVFSEISTNTGNSIDFIFYTSIAVFLCSIFLCIIALSLQTNKRELNNGK